MMFKDCAIRMAIIAVSSVLFAGNDAHAQSDRYRWISHGEQQAGVIDTLSFEQRPGGVRGQTVVTAITWQVFRKPLTDGTQIERRKVRFLCGGGSNRTIELLQATADGTVLVSEPIGYAAQSDEGFQRGTPMGNAYVMACTDQRGDFRPPIDTLRPLNEVFGFRAEQLLR